MWNANQYLKFDQERTQPCHDLVARISVDSVNNVIDLGCGPGNSTQVLRDRWPNAEITGLDNSQDMLDKARSALPEVRWIHQDISAWAAEAGEPFDVVFSNAALHWVPDHEVIVPRLLKRTHRALAVQMPGNIKGPAQQLMRELACSGRWNQALGNVRNWQAHEPEFYYDLLSPFASNVDLWTTDYIHVMQNGEAIVEWYKGTALRPYLNALNDDSDRKKFLAELLDGFRALYPPRPNGRVLFPFRRVFMIAYCF